MRVTRVSWRKVRVGMLVRQHHLPQRVTEVTEHGFATRHGWGRWPKVGSVKVFQ